jgi:hypothetical protein
MQRRRKQRRKNMVLAVSEVKRLVVEERESFMDASCMVISWFVVNHLDDEMGDDGLGLARELDLQAVIQELIRAVFATRGSLQKT